MFVLFLVCAVFGSCSFCFALFLICALFGSCPFWFVLILASPAFGLCLFWLVNQKQHEPKRAQTKKSMNQKLKGTNQKEHEPKRAQTKKGTNQKQHEPKRARTKKGTNQNTLSFYNNEPSKNKHLLILLSSLARNSQKPKLKRIFEIP